MSSRKWIPDTGPFQAALNKVKEEYQAVIKEEISDSLTYEESIVDSLRKAEKQTSATVGDIKKQLGKLDLAELDTESRALENSIANVDRLLDECVDEILAIDQLIPAHDRLIAPGLPNEQRLPLLHERISKTSLKKAPMLLDVSRVKAETKVNNEYATNSSSNNNNNT